MYPQSIFEKNMKNVKNSQLKTIVFTALKITVYYIGMFRNVLTDLPKALELILCFHIVAGTCSCGHNQCIGLVIPFLIL